jgi:hypothetical protein
MGNSDSTPTGTVVDFLDHYSKATVQFEKETLLWAVSCLLLEDTYWEKGYTVLMNPDFKNQS